MHDEYENKNQELYQRMFDEIHAPDALAERIINAINRKKKYQNMIRFGYGFAAAAAVFIASNVITYAATGESWTEKFIVSINGTETEVEMQYSTEDDSTTIQKLDINLSDYVEGQNGSVHIESTGRIDSVIIDMETVEIYVELDDYDTEVSK